MLFQPFHDQILTKIAFFSSIWQLTFWLSHIKMFANFDFVTKVLDHHSHRIANSILYHLHISETWKLTKQTENSLRIAQRAMERAMLRITQRDRKRSIWIRDKTKVKDIIQVVKQQKWRQAGRVARMNDKRWTKRFIYSIIL